MTKKILYRGAEAEIRLSEYMGKIVVQKQRVQKAYRIKEIDEQLIASRTKEEAKLIAEARSHGVSVPVLYDVDLVNGAMIAWLGCLMYTNGVRMSLDETLINQRFRTDMVEVSWRD